MRTFAAWEMLGLINACDDAIRMLLAVPAAVRSPTEIPEATGLMRFVRGELLRASVGPVAVEPAPVVAVEMAEAA
jgi:hypothetical protein